MHELTLAESVIQIVEAAAVQGNVQRVTRVKLAIGALAHVESEALQYCCEVVSRGGVAEGAVFEIERPPGQARCTACEQVFLLERLALGCPACGSFQLKVIDGEQMKVMEIGVSELHGES